MQQTKFKEITTIKNPRQAFFVTDHQVVVNGESGCSIIDLKANTEVKKISDSSNAYLAIHPDRSVFVLAHPDDINIYDATTGTHRCDYYSPFRARLQTITSAVFNNSEDIFVSHTADDDQHNKYRIARFIHDKDCYMKPINETITDRLIGYEHDIDTRSSLQNIICHPTNENLVCLIDNNTGRISVKNLETHCEDIRSHRHPFTAYHGKILNGEYSPDGSLLACCGPLSFFIIDTNSCSEETLVAIPKKIQAITFHPEGSIIAALSDKEGIKNIDYWDIKNKKIIMSIALPEIHEEQSLFTNLLSWFTKKEKDNKINASLSFSPNTKNLIVITENKCFYIPVPLGITCRTNIQETAFLHWLLKHYQIDHNSILPDDVRQFITHIFLETCKR